MPLCASREAASKRGRSQLADRRGIRAWVLQARYWEWGRPLATKQQYLGLACKWSGPISMPAIPSYHKELTGMLAAQA